ncbi:site-specific integrase, partial [Vibrio parahaemolyticus]|nr:site-specific integrase [Vibrio parahaemolyticus]
MHDTNNDKEELVSHAKVNVPAEQSIRGELLPSSSSLRNIQDNPAVAYLVSLGSKRSRQTMSSFLNIVAKMIGFQNLRDCAWSSMRRHHILAVLEMLGDAGKAPATINTYLSALKGVALEAWTMKQI